MIEKLEKIKEKALNEISKCSDEASLNNVKSEYMGKKSVFNEIMVGMKDLSQEEKREVGSKSNEVRNEITKAIDEKLNSIKTIVLASNNNKSLSTGFCNTGYFSPNFSE